MKNTCAGEMSLLPLLNLGFAFKLGYFVSVVGLSINHENFMLSYSLHVWSTEKFAGAKPMCMFVDLLLFNFFSRVKMNALDRQ